MTNTLFLPLNVFVSYSNCLWLNKLSKSHCELKVFRAGLSEQLERVMAKQQS